MYDSVTREAPARWVLANGRCGLDGIDGRRLIVVLVYRLRLVIFESALIVDRASLLRREGRLLIVLVAWLREICGDFRLLEVVEVAVALAAGGLVLGIVKVAPPASSPCRSPASVQLRRMTKQAACRYGSFVLQLRREAAPGELGLGVELLPRSDDFVRIYLLLVIIENHLLLQEIVVVVVHILYDVLGGLPDDVLVAHIDLVLIASAARRRRDVPIL